MKKLVFTDLDGTLLDHHSYDYSAALPAIEKLNVAEVPWIITTSKTHAEVIDLKQELSNPFPYIVENGAGIFWPEGRLQSSFIPNGVKIQTLECGAQYVSLSKIQLPEILALSYRYKKQLDLKFVGFSEMSAEQVVECTGLTIDKASRAKQRQFSEPLLWQDTEAKFLEFQKVLAPYDLQLIKGGRFVHLMGLSNKGMALTILKKYFQQQFKESLVTMALGDGENDISLLEASDYPVIVRSPVNAPPKVKHPKVIITAQYGPEGWNQAVLDWLNRIN